VIVDVTPRRSVDRSAKMIIDTSSTKRCDLGRGTRSRAPLAASISVLAFAPPMGVVGFYLDGCTIALLIIVVRAGDIVDSRDAEAGGSSGNRD